jgi:hypothetical protein
MRKISVNRTKTRWKIFIQTAFKIETAFDMKLKKTKIKFIARQQQKKKIK